MPTFTFENKRVGHRAAALHTPRPRPRPVAAAAARPPPATLAHICLQ